MSDRRWTFDSIEAACRRALIDRATLRVTRLPMTHSAECSWAEPAGRANIRVDAHEVGVRTGTIHELLHVVLSEALSGFDDYLSEEIICALEVRLNMRISLSKRRVEWWRRAINKKLPKRDARLIGKRSSGGSSTNGARGRRS